MSWDLFERELRKIEKITERIRREMDRMLRGLVSEGRIPSPPLPIRGYKEPLVDVYETEDEVVVLAELPGVNKENIIVDASEDSVRISAEVKKEVEEKERGYLKREREYLGFRRTVSLPVKVDPKGAKATYKNGILEIRLPKLEKKERVRVEIE